jgi:very-short-patch-repair endonuclease
VVEAADARAANPFESVLRAVALTVPGLVVEPQGEVPGVGWVDLLDRRLGLVVEAESHEFHGTRAGLRRDVTRYTEITRRGLRVVRFLWEEAMFDQARVREVLQDVVRLGPTPIQQAVQASRRCAQGGGQGGPPELPADVGF